MILSALMCHSYIYIYKVTFHLQKKEATKERSTKKVMSEAHAILDEFQMSFELFVDLISRTKSLQKLRINVAFLDCLMSVYKLLASFIFEIKFSGIWIMYNKQFNFKTTFLNFLIENLKELIIKNMNNQR